MRILHVIHSADPKGGGPIEGVLQRGRRLLQMGHKIEIATLDTESVENKEIPIHILGERKAGYSRSPKLQNWLNAHAGDFDAVVVNGIWQFHGYAVWRALRGKSTPYFVFTHGMLDPWFKQAYPLKHIKKSIYWRLAESKVLRDAAAVLFTSEEEKLLARNAFRPYRITERVVQYGTAGPEGNPQELAAKFRTQFPQLADRPFLLYLSRIHPKKGVDLLLNAFAKHASVDPNLMLTIAGPDQVGWQAELERIAKERGIADRIVWTGMLTGDLKWGAYHASDAFVLPSHQENFGIVVAEALACGKPVLISNKVNIWREIEAAGAGYVASDDQQGTDELLSRWLATGEAERVAMGKRAVECFRSSFEIEGSARSLLEVIQEFDVQRTSP
ncbi:MAG TPA: glycosyltransferase [Fimbriimonadaceae bacterium]|nr:glycosyltransferase [Fimbriimonadaceae bacterium]